MLPERRVVNHGLRRTRRSALIAGIAATVLISIPAFSADGSTVLLARYVAGSSVAHEPQYNSIAKTMDYKCSFAGWAHVKVNWTCTIKEGSGPGAVTLGSFDGSFSDGSANPAWHSVRMGSGRRFVCVYAYAAYNDGSGSDADQYCS
jgi:hypothetical protein